MAAKPPNEPGKWPATTTQKATNSKLKTTILAILSAALCACANDTAYWQARQDAIATLPRSQQAQARIELMCEWHAQKQEQQRRAGEAVAAGLLGGLAAAAAVNAPANPISYDADSDQIQAQTNSIAADQYDLQYRLSNIEANQQTAARAAAQAAADAQRQRQLDDLEAQRLRSHASYQQQTGW